MDTKNIRLRDPNFHFKNQDELKTLAVVWVTKIHSLDSPERVLSCSRLATQGTELTFAGVWKQQALSASHARFLHSRDTCDVFEFQPTHSRP